MRVHGKEIKEPPPPNSKTKRQTKRNILQNKGKKQAQFSLTEMSISTTKSIKKQLTFQQQPFSVSGFHNKCL